MKVLSRSTLSRYEQVVSDLVSAEQAEGWLARCDDAGQHLVASEELVETMGRLLAQLGAGPVVEVCAGDGSLAGGLGGVGAAVVATDVRPPIRQPWKVRTLSARQALEKFRPRVVLGSFVPVDGGVDLQVFAASHVRHYLVLNARLGDTFGSRTLWEHPGWTRTPLPELNRWLITRHDAWLGEHLPILHRGEAWLLSRTSPSWKDSRPPLNGGTS